MNICPGCGKSFDYEPITQSSDPESEGGCYECLPEDDKRAYDRWEAHERAPALGDSGVRAGRPIFQGKLLSLPVDLVGKLNAIQHAPDDEIRVRDVRRLMKSWRKFRDDMGWYFDEVLGFRGVAKPPRLRR